MCVCVILGVTIVVMLYVIVVVKMCTALFVALHFISVDILVYMEILIKFSVSQSCEWRGLLIAQYLCG